MMRLVPLLLLLAAVATAQGRLVPQTLVKVVQPAEAVGKVARQAGITFLLDASLGLISLQQNNVMKIFSVFAVVVGLSLAFGGLRAIVSLSAFAHPREVMLRWLDAHRIPRRWIGAAILQQGDHLQAAVGLVREPGPVTWNVAITTRGPAVLPLELIPA